MVRPDLLIWLVDIVNCDDGKILVVTEVSKCDSCSTLQTQLFDLFLGHVQGNGHAEEVAIGQSVVLDDAAKCELVGFPGI